MLFCLCAAGNAFGASLIWAVNATFNDGGSVSGSFDYDPGTSTVSSWNLYTSSGSTIASPQPYNNNATNSAVSVVGASSITFSIGSRSLNLVFSSSLTASGGSVSLSPSTNEVSGTNTRSVASGSVNAPTPQSVTISPIPNAIIGTSPPPLSAKASGGSLAPLALPATFASITPSICKTSQAQIVLLTVGFCNIQSGPTLRGFTISDFAAGTLTPSPGSPFTTGSFPAGSAVGDFNEDGKPDLAVVNNSSNSVTILLGNGTGSFTPASASPSTGSGPYAVAVGDFNGDGHLDLAVGNFTDGTVTILLGTGAGGFNPASGSPVSANASLYWIAAGDFNGDGVLDLVTVSKSASGGATILLGNGAGGFTKDSSPSNPYATGTNATDVVVADMNNDGISDLVIANAAAIPSVTVLLGTGALGSGAPLFTPASGSPYTMSFGAYGIVVGDFNADGRPDFAVAGSTVSNTVSVMLQQSGGGFAAATNSPFTVGTQPFYLATGDFNGDGIIDLAVANLGSSNTTLLLGDGTGNFTQANGSPFTTGASGNQSFFPVIGDFNSDGIDDLAVTNNLADNVAVLLGTLAPTTTTLSSTAPLNITANTAIPLSAALANTGTAFSPAANGNHFVNFYDGTTLLQQVLGSGSPVTYTIPSGFPSGIHNITAVYQSVSGNANSTSNTLTFTVGTAQTITFNPPPDVAITASPVTLSASATSGLAVTFSSNSTGICTAGGTNGATVTLLALGTCSITASQSGNGSFAAATPVTQTFQVLQAQTITFDTIPNQIFGVPPFAVAAQASSLLPVTLTVQTASVCSIAGNVVQMLTTGTCSIQATQPGDNVTYAAATPVTQSFAISNGAPAGTLTASPPISFTGPNQPAAMAKGDFNGDGIPDVVIANGSANTVTAFLSNLNGGFTAGTPASVGNAPSALATGDFNGDGNADLVVTNSADGTISVLLGDGRGNFSQPSGSPYTVTGGAVAGNIGVADFNSDGILDLAIPDVSSQKLTVMLGDGMGSFTSETPLSISNLGGIAIADFIGSGIPGIAFITGNDVNLLFGRGDGTFSPNDAPAFPVGTAPIQVIALDLNRDGHPDLIVKNRNSNDVTVLLGNGFGGFAPSAGSPFALNLTSPGDMRVADFNGDGNTDIVVADALSSTIRILLGDGTGNFVPAFSTFSTGTSSSASRLVAADFNGDGIEDLAIARADDNLLFLRGGAVSTTTTITTTSVPTVTTGTNIPLTVAVADNGPAFSGPTGLVNIFDNSSGAGSADFSGAPANFNVTASPTGTHNYTAQYGGSSGITGSTTATPVTITVVTAGSTPQTLTFNAPPNQIGLSSFSIASNALASSGLTVEFASNSISICSTTGAAGATVTLLRPGTCSITASQPGDTTYAPATPVTQTFTVQLTQTITFDPIPNQILGGAVHIIAAQASSLLPVTIAGTTPSVCQVSDDVVLLKTAGTCSIQASQGGDATYVPATTVTRNFTVSQALPTGILTPPASSPFSPSDPGPFTVATADFNNDGNPDLVFITQNGAVVELGDGMGNFSQSAFVAVNCSISVVAGDFNGDGKPDFAVADSCDSNAAVFLGDGTGAFSPATNSPFATGLGPNSIAVGDFNGDGIQDLVTADFSDNNGISVLIGTGNGQFTTTNPAVTASQPTFVAVGDFDLDGKPDIALLNLSTTNVRILLGDGSGGFTQTTGPFPTGNGPQSMVVADLNSDGKPDLAIANTNDGTITVLLNQGSGNFAAAPNSPFNSSLGDGILAVGDFNGDGIPDLAQTNSGTDQLNIFLGDGTGKFTAAANNPINTGINPTAALAADFNRDGREDLVFTNFDDNKFSVYLGATVPTTSTISSTSPATITFGANVPLTLTVSDNAISFNPLTGSVAFFDGSTNIGTASQSTSPYSLTVNSPAAGTHLYTATYGGGSGSAGSTSTNSVTINVQQTQTITFNPLPNVTFGVSPFTISASASSGLTVSFTSNTTPVCTVSGTTVTIVAPGMCSITASQAGNSSYAAATPVTQTFTVLQTQSITFDAIPNQIFGVQPFAVAAQASSLLAVSLASTTTSVCKVADDVVTLLGAGTCSITASQPGNSTFAAAANVTKSFTVSQATVSGTLAQSSGSPFAAGTNPSSVVTGDFNNDGKPDLVIPDAAGNTVTVLLGDGTGAFAQASGSPITLTGTPEKAVVGDFNGDGNQDFAVLLNTLNKVAIFLGNGTGAFTQAAGSPIGTGAGPAGIAVADFTGDGIQDLAISNFGNSVQIFSGNGSGGFTATGILNGFSQPSGIVTADFNGDGIPDLAVANSGSGGVAILLGNGTGGFTATAASPITTGLSPSALAVTDFNGDGKLDLVINNIGTTGSVVVLLGDGTGGFSAAANSPFTVGTAPSDVTAGDFNGDGIPDIAVANKGSNNITLLLGNGTGGFTQAAGSPFSAGQAPAGILIGDFNRDGIEDIAVVNGTDNNVTVYLGELTPTTTTLSTTSPATITVGTPISLTATVADTTSAYQTLTGTVTISDNSTNIGTASQTTSPYSFTISGPAAGMHVYSASYGGGSGSAASATTTSITINVQQTQTITFNPLPNVTFGVSPFTISATATSGLTVTFLSNTTGVCTVSGTTVTIAASGTCSITANQAGNTTFAAAAPVTQAFTVLATQTITFNSLPNVNQGAAPFTIGATASSGLTVSFASNTTSVCTVSGTTVTIVTAGTCSITASQSGDSTYAAATPVTQSFTVLQTQTITFNSLPNVTIGVSPFTISASATSGLTVSFASNTTSVCTVSGTTVTILAAGTCSITATQAGNSTFAAATPVTQAFTALATQTITFDTIPNQIFGVSPFPVAAQSNSLLAVTFASNTASICKLAGNLVQILTTGTCSITASQAGNGTFAPASPVTNTFTISNALISGTLTAAPASPVAAGTSPYMVAAADFNGDGKLDMAVADNNGQVTVLLGDGAGGFSPASNSPFTAGPGAYFIAAGDFNGDGLADLAIPNEGTNNITVLLGQANGNFTGAPGSPFTVGVNPDNVAVGDFNGDGIQDLAVTNDNDGNVTILLGNGSGGFSPAPGSPVTTATNPLSVAVGDFNGDGIQDLAVANYNGASVSILIGNGSGGFTAATPITGVTNPAALAVGDFNGDGIQDVAIADLTNNRVAVMLGNGSAAFTAASGSPFSTGTSPRGLVIADFNGDGIADIATANQGSTNATVLLGDGTGGFTAAAGSAFGAGSLPLGLTAADFNGDGIEDLVVANSGDNTVTLLLGSLSQTSSVISTTSPSTIILGANVPLTLNVSQVTSAYRTLTGTATFFDNGNSIGAGSQTTSPYSITAASPALGTHVYTASYAGGSGSAASATTSSVTINVVQSQTITFNPLPNVTIGVSPFTISATATSGLTVSFTSNTTSVCTVSGTTVTIATAGTCSITASQAGNASFAPAPPVTQTFTVLQTQTITFNSLPNVTIGVSPFTISATASSGLTVSFASNTTSVCTVSGTTVTIVTTGTCSITASQAGDGTFATATPVTQSFTVLQTQTITFSSLPNVTIGIAPFTIGATATSGLTVSFASNTTSVCTVSGTTVTIVTIGTCSITASQAGDTTYAAAAPVTQTFTVLQTQTITFNSLPNVNQGVAPFTLSATATSGLTVSFASNTTSVCTVSGTTVTVLIAGTCSITASQAGNGTYAAATPVTQMFNVLGPQTITFDAIPNQILGVSPFALAAQTNALLPVTLASQTPVVCTTASVTVTLLKTGTCTIKASQAGNNNFQPAASVTNSFTVTAANAAGTLSPESSQPAAGTNPWSIAAGDFNGDGHPDVAVADNGSNNVTLLLGDGRGGFTPAANSPLAAGAQPQSVVTGDFNGDGHLDLAIANSGDNTVTILLGDGSGGFSAATGSPNPAGTQPVGLAVGDFNGDGIQDLAVADSSGNTTTLLLGLGTGAFTLGAPSTALNSSNPNAVAVGDINGDGIPDLVIASAGDNTVRVLLGNGTGGFAAAPGSPVTVGTGPLSVVIGDFNGDGFADFATANNGSNGVTVMLGDGAGHFAASAGSPFPAGTGPRSLAAFDFNGDKIQDLAVADTGGGVAVLQGTGNGSFFAAGPFSAGTTPYSVAVADFNGDGYEDVVVANEGGGTVSVLVGAVPVVPPAPPPPASLSLIISPSPVSTTVGAPVTASFNVSGGTGPFQFSASGLPPGVSVSGAGLTGSTAAAGTFSVIVKVQDSTATIALAPLTINVLGLTTTSLPPGTVGQPYVATLSAAGGLAAYAFSATGLPPGLTLSAAGNLSGTPTAAGTYAVNVSVTSGGLTSTMALAIAIGRPGAVVISNATLPGGKVNVAYSQAFTATGGVPPYTFAIATGSPPPGLSMNSAGIVSGTPATPGTYVFGITATDTTGGTASAAASITIDPAPLQVTTTNLPSGMYSVPYPTQQFGVSGGISPFTFGLTGGSLPGGLTFSGDGVLSGTPQLTGTSSSHQPKLVAHASDGSDSFTVGVTVTDGAGTKTNIQLPLSVRPKAADLILTTGSLSFALATPAQSTPAPQVVGIQSTDPSQVLSYTLAVNPSVSWLAISSATVTPNSINVSVTNDALTLTPGTYTTQITATCTSASCSGHVLSVAVTLTVTELPPQLSVSTNLLSFTTTNTSTGSQDGSINISNAGGGVLTFSKISCAAAWCTAGPGPASLAGGVSTTIPVTINPLGLTPNFYRTQVDIATSGGLASVPVTLFISANATMTLSPSGQQFIQLQGSAPGNRSGSLLVAVNSTSPVSYTASILSIQNAAPASWLVLGNAAGTAMSSQPGTVTYSIDPAAAAQLPAGAYYAIISVASSQISNSPQNYEVVLNVAPANTPVAPEPQPAGLLFIKSGNGLPAPQTVNIYSAANQPATYQASATTTSGGNWLSVSPNTGTSSASAPGVSTVTVDTSKLSPGVYYGGVSYSLSATAVRTVSVTLIVPAAGTSTSSRPGTQAPRDAGCKPSALVPAQTGLVNSFSQPAGWPTPLAINLADNCGNLITNGRIVASFTNGDPPLVLPLADASTALYSGTWSPAHSSSQVTINLTASAQGFQNAANQITGAVAPNAVPVISPNATLHVFDPLVGGALAPGTIIAVYGQYLATGTASPATIPLPTNFEDTSVIIGNSYAPIYYASPTQLNVQVPFELTPGQQYDLFVSVNGKLSTPQPIQLSNVAPGFAAFASGGIIAQHLADGSLITAASPAVPGEYVQAYLAGLGSTTVNVPSGDASPSSPLALPSDMPVLTINGTSYPIYFVGLTPTLVGLYQIDFQVPAGLKAGNLNVTITQNGVTSNMTTLPYQP